MFKQLVLVGYLSVPLEILVGDGPDVELFFLLLRKVRNALPAVPTAHLAVTNVTFLSNADFSLYTQAMIILSSDSKSTRSQLFLWSKHFVSDFNISI